MYQNTNSISKELKKLYSNSKVKQIYVFFDYGVIALIKEPTLSNQWDFQHFIYHTAVNQKVKCAYISKESVGEAMKKGDYYGMQTFNQSLEKLYTKELVKLEKN